MKKYVTTCDICGKEFNDDPISYIPVNNSDLKLLKSADQIVKESNKEKRIIVCGLDICNTCNHELRNMIRDMQKLHDKKTIPVLDFEIDIINDEWRKNEQCGQKTTT